MDEENIIADWQDVRQEPVEVSEQILGVIKSKYSFTNGELIEDGKVLIRNRASEGEILGFILSKWHANQYIKLFGCQEYECYKTSLHEYGIIFNDEDLNVKGNLVLYLDNIDPEVYEKEDVLRSIDWSHFNKIYTGRDNSNLKSLLDNIGILNKIAFLESDFSIVITTHLQSILDIKNIKKDDIVLLNKLEEYCTFASNLQMMDKKYGGLSETVTLNIKDNEICNNDFKVKFDCLSDMILENKSYNIYIPTDLINVPDFNKSYVFKFIEVLAIYKLYTGNEVNLIVNEESPITVHYNKALIEYSSLKFGTCKERIMKHIITMLHFNSENELQNIPIFMTTYKNHNYIGCCTRNDSYEIIKYISWNSLKTLLKKTTDVEQQKNINLEFNRFTEYKNNMYPHDFSITPKILDFEELWNGSVEVLELNYTKLQEFDSNLQLFSQDNVYTTNVNYTNVGKSTFEKCQLWAGICRVLEQIMNDKPYEKLITIRDIILFIKDGELQVGYYQCEEEYEILYTNGDYVFKDVTKTFDFIPLKDSFGDDIYVDKYIKLFEDYNSMPQKGTYEFTVPAYLSTTANLYKSWDFCNEALMYSTKSGRGVSKYEELNDTMMDVDPLQMELANWYNVEMYYNLAELNKYISAYGSRLVQSPINIFGGLILDSTDHKKHHIYLLGRQSCETFYVNHKMFLDYGGEERAI